MGSDHEEKPLKKSKRKHRKEEEDGDKMEVDETPKAVDSAKKEKKKHKEKKRKEREEEAENDGAEVEPAASPEKKHKKHKSDDKKEKKHKQPKSTSSPDKPAAEPTGTKQKPHVPDESEYPFFTQTFSQRIPIWPAAFDEPLTKMQREYLDPMLNRYSPKFKGVLLEYKNANLSHRPQRADPKRPSTDETPVLMESVECYAPPFAWLTADLHLFIPSRGAWMEGEINLQSEGHIGVVCFEKFNASISRRSLPRGWKWVEQPDEEVVEEEEPVVAEDDPFTEKAEGEGAEDGETARDTHQVRSSGHWVDENGDRVSGKVHFRIKNFSSGSTGDYTYLSLQGTMLDEEAERKSVAEERETEKARRARQNASGLLYPTMRLPEFSMTKLKDDLI
ncbi:hypothetical protein VPNG_05406 [Cytospora leucostoma]|uniref:DNA-directed RNA polymerase subunit n=1 Tax=Cytospora leucostoma TaxID=1230097 RepID=A0A423X4T5_9PEZI|nr:hypothetical protein VPNG_05406 [Cytospora leucostoma]